MLTQGLPSPLDYQPGTHRPLGRLGSLSAAAFLSIEPEGEGRGKAMGQDQGYVPGGCVCVCVSN